MPTEKRARQRAAREARRLAELKAARRRGLLRNAIVVIVIAAVVVGIVLYTTRTTNPTVASQSATNKSTTTTAPTTTTTTAPTTTTTAATTTTTTSAPATSTPPATTTTAKLTAAQTTANTKAAAAGCPATPKTRVNTLQWPKAPTMTINMKKTYKATFKTTAGTVVVTLFAKKAPKTVNSFVFLAKQGYYHCVVFSRVVPGFMNQTGDPTGTDAGGPGYHFKNENVPKAYAGGELAMANSGGNDTNGSQFFFLVTSGAKILDGDLTGGGGYSLFGKVSQGMTVVNTINTQGNTTKSANGIPPRVIQRILTVTVTT